MQTLLQTALLAVTAIAASLPTQIADGTNGFRLWANMIYPDLGPEWGSAVQGYELSYASSSQCQAEVILVPANQGSTFYAKNNTIGLYFEDESPLFAGMGLHWRATATVPSGRPVKLKCLDGTQGLTLTTNGVYYPGEMGPDFNGAFMACGREYIFLSFFAWGQRPLYGCTVVQLLPIY
ncbi:hypothetical protein CGRA01v4_04278 [Colletotrichum graminicola]|uniref:DUF7907 domain-containing protein n=1 Tax=Colletotrichum graminicola (strain M1.001 / M2 / FGSC 10212) TaxID=645133 RepID=E3Q948_COLGM|nr:uncharacterized protein GLRG_01722 [Colletotrichum graminicola M1.001]EFQ27227.1 hypothetical protein GLRG_01722 [Colletotrichum graminicola M1.001]WDK12997.1 hypothetical protein CGRA01v4_04278 [Colletotrichum graminicola]